MRCLVLLVGIVAGAGCPMLVEPASGEAGETDGFQQVGPLRVKHVLVADLGEEHIANTVHRQGRDGLRLVAWGRRGGGRILEWPFRETPPAVETARRRKGKQFSNGGCALDIDGDGIEELILAQATSESTEFVWFQERPGRSGWQEHSLGRYPTGGFSAPHDIRPLIMTGPDEKELKGIVAVMGRRTLIWFQVPEDPMQPWPRRKIARLPARRQSGMVLGDIAGAGRPDIVCGMFFVQCPPDPTHGDWTPRRYGRWDENDWGGMTKHALVDLTGDGRPEIVAAEAEIPDARLGIFRRNPEDPDGLWNSELIDEGLYCPHSLAVTDLSGDGRPDIVVGEMTAGGWSFPRNENPRILAYINGGDGTFERHVLSEGLGVHEMGHLVRDGRVILYAADEIQPQKFPGMQTHVSYWIIEPGVSPEPGCRTP